MNSRSSSSPIHHMTMKWEQNGELSAKDLHELISRLAHVEDHHQEELIRLTNRNQTSN